MKLTYYDNWLRLVDDISNYKQEDVKLSVDTEQNWITLCIDDDELLIRISTAELSVRSFSVPWFPVAGYYLILEDNYNRSFDGFIKYLQHVCTSYSTQEIDAISRDMPLTSFYARENSDTLRGVAIIWRDHFLEENISLLGAFCHMGVNSDNILALDKGDNTKHRAEITATFKRLGYYVGILDNANLTDIKHFGPVLDFIEQRKDKQIIVIDDGAIISNLLSVRAYNNIAAIIELTEMGLRRIAEIEKSLMYPVLNVAKTRLKRCLIYPEIANSIFLRIIELLGSEKLVGRTLLLCGYGDLGSVLADRFRSFGVKVIVTDPDILKLIIAAEKGYKTYKDPVNAIHKEVPFLVVGTSGYMSITKDMLLALPDNAFITAGATADLSVFKQFEQEGITHCKIINYGTQYMLENKCVTVLGNGRSVNLFNSEAIPNKSNDIFKTAILLTTLMAIRNKDNLKNGLDLGIVEKWIDSSKIYEQYYGLYIEH